MDGRAWMRARPSKRDHSYEIRWNNAEHDQRLGHWSVLVGAGERSRRNGRDVSWNGREMDKSGESSLKPGEK